MAVTIPALTGTSPVAVGTGTTGTTGTPGATSSSIEDKLRQLVTLSDALRDAIVGSKVTGGGSAAPVAPTSACRTRGMGDAVAPTNDGERGHRRGGRGHGHSENSGRDHGTVDRGHGRSERGERRGDQGRPAPTAGASASPAQVSGDGAPSTDGAPSPAVPPAAASEAVPAAPPAGPAKATFPLAGGEPHRDDGFGSTAGRSMPHGGVDITVPGGSDGKPILAMGGGTVVENGFHDGWGNTIVIDHGNGFLSRYAHMQERSPHAVGAKVDAGQELGRVGTTGRSTGPHLHVEVMKGGSGTGNAVDPMPYLDGTATLG